MPELEKVIKGLEQFKSDFKPFCGNSADWKRVDDAIALLKGQDAVKPKYNARTNWYECGNCHYSMTSGMHCRSELIPATKVRYCANCGFPINWKGL